MKKRVLPLLLTLALCLSLFVLPAASAPEEFVIEDGVLLAYNGPGGEVIIPEGVVEIGIMTFYDRTDLKKITFPSSLKGIGSMAFMHCTGLTELTFPSNMEEIGGLAFLGCTSLRSLTLPDGLQKLESGAFLGCVSLERVHIPGSVALVEGSVFQDCVNLTSVTLAQGVKLIDDGAFDSCVRLKEVNLPDSLESVSFLASFRNTPWLEAQGDFLVHDGVLLGYQGKSGDVVIPNDVTYIGYNALCGNRYLTSVTIPGSVKGVGDNAFSDCSSLRRVVLEDGVETIGEWAFAGCTALREVTIPQSVTSILSDAFSATPWLEEQEGLVLVHDILLAYHGIDTAVTIPDSVTAIADGAFYGNETLTSVTIPESVQRIGSHAFSDCPLTQVSIPEGLTDLGAFVFANTPWAHAQGDFFIINGVLVYYQGDGGMLTIPAGIQHIGKYACNWDDNITCVTIPGSVKAIDEGAFENCDGLSAAILQEGVERIEALAFTDCDYLAAVSLPASLSYIAEDAFDPIDPVHTVFRAPAGSYAETWLTDKGLQVSPPDTPVSVFTDITGYYTIPVLWAVREGITKGTSPTTFSPERVCTREEVITMLWRAAGSPEAEEAIPFTDVSPADYSYPAICWAYANEIAGGTDDTHFSPKAPCTRSQAVLFLGNYGCEFKWGYVDPEDTFDDVPAEADYAWAVNWAVENWITEGTSETTFSPDRPCTRGQIAAFLYRMVTIDIV